MPQDEDFLMAQPMAPELSAHLERDPTDGEPRGKDPRKLSVENLQSFGLERQSRGDAVRAKCIECCCGSPGEVRRCGDIKCALWPFRMGNDPWRTPMSEERRQAASERLKAGRNREEDADG